MFGEGIRTSVPISAGISVACLGFRVLGLPPLRGGGGGEDPKSQGDQILRAWGSEEAWPKP